VCLIGGNNAPIWPKPLAGSSLAILVTSPRLVSVQPHGIVYVREMSFGMSRSGSRWQRRRLKELTASFIPYFRLISHEAPTPSACPPPRPFPVRQQRIRTDIHGSRLVAGDRSATALPPHTASPRRVGIASLSTSVWSLGYRMACPVMRTVVAPSTSSAGFRWISGYVGAIPGSRPCTYLMRDDISTAQRRKLALAKGGTRTRHPRSQGQ